MAKDNPQSEKIAAAIGLLKNAAVGWPEGYANPLLREIFQKAEADLKEELFRAEVNKKDKRRTRTSKEIGGAKE